jgi:hypothetical protein
MTILGLQRPQMLCSALLNAGRPAALNATPRIWLWVAHSYRAIPIAGDPVNGWTVSTSSYYYAYTTSEAQKPEIIAYHWHPDGEGAFRWPHLHIGAAWTAERPRFSSHWHVPSGRVPLEHVLRFAIRELGVVPIDREYESVFDGAMTQFDQDQFRADRPPG